MKVIKKIAPILLILTIILCLLFCFLAVLRAPINNWHSENIREAYYEWLEDFFGIPFNENVNADESNLYISTNSTTFEVETDINTTTQYAPSIDEQPPLKFEATSPNSFVIIEDATILEGVLLPRGTNHYSFSRNAFDYGFFPLLSTILNKLIPTSGSFLGSLFAVVCDCLVPATVIFISIIILALYFVLQKTKTSISPSGKFGKIAKIFSIISLGAGLLASLLICLLSLPVVIESTIALVKAPFDDYDAAYWSGIAVALVEFLLSLVNIAAFFLIAISMILFLVITIKSKQATKVQNKKSLVALCLISAVGTVASSFVTLHFAMSTIFSITANIIAFVRFGFAMRDVISFVVQLLTALGLLILASSIAVGFIITLLKAIISLKRSRKKELYAYNSDELALFDTPEESTDGSLLDDNINEEAETGNETDEIALTEIEIKEDV